MNGEPEWPKRISFCVLEGIAAASYEALAAALDASGKTKAETVAVQRKEGATFSFADLFDAIRDRRADTAILDTVSLLEILGAGTSGCLSREGGPFPVRDALPTYGDSTMRLSSSFMVRRDSKIRSPFDIERGTRIADLTPTMPQMRDLYMALLSWSGLDEGDVEFVPFNSVMPSVDGLIDGKVDVVYAMPTSRGAKKGEASDPGIAWVQLNPKASDRDREGSRRFRQWQPLYAFVQNQQGVPSAKGMWGIAPSGSWVVRADADFGLVYNFVKWMVENYDSYKLKAIELQGTDPASIRMGLDDAYIPVHEGAVRYFKERGIWKDADDLRQRYNVAVLNMYIDAYQEAISRADKSGIEVAPRSAEWVRLWEDQKRARGVPRFAILSDDEIADALKRIG